MRKGERTRELIIKCSEQVFAEKGYYLTPVSDIANMAYVAKGTIYQYFENKEDLFLTLLKGYTEDWKKSVALDLVDFTGDRPPIHYAREYVKHRIYNTANFFSENPDRCKIILRMGIGVNETIEELVREIEEEILSIIIRDIDLGKRQGNVPDEIHSEIAANSIIGAIFRLAYFYFVLKKSSFKELKLEGLMDIMVILVLKVLSMD